MPDRTDELIRTLQQIAHSMESINQVLIRIEQKMH